MPFENTKMFENFLVRPLSKLVSKQPQTKLMHTPYNISHKIGNHNFRKEFKEFWQLKCKKS